MIRDLAENIEKSTNYNLIPVIYENYLIDSYCIINK
jgi:hypothetical protein